MIVAENPGNGFLKLLIEGFQKQMTEQNALNEARHTQNLHRMDGLRDDIAEIKAAIVPLEDLPREVDQLKTEGNVRRGVLIGLGALGGGGAVAYWKPVLAALGLVKP